MSDNFYQDLKGFDQFADLTRMEHYITVPPDWYVVITDVKGSTQAIDEGRYKDVNLVGAAAIIAILNIAQRIPIPYAFGGDGATVIIPPYLLEEVQHTLSAVQTRVKSTFDLDLRAGCIPVSALYENGAWLKVAKFQLSPTVFQAAFQGTGLALAETWLKKGGGTVIRCEQTDDSDLSLEGLECRWEPIQNRHGTMVSLLVRVTPQYESTAWGIYSKLLSEISLIYPESCGAFPVTSNNMQLSFDPKKLKKEANIRNRTFISRTLYLMLMYVQNTVGNYIFKTKGKIGGIDGERYLSELAANTDARKFDEMLRMVLDSTIEQKEQLETLLKTHQQKGEIAYGIHLSPQALMTCLVFSMHGDHIHFVDGSDGGYALAAKQMKQQLSA